MRLLGSVFDDGGAVGERRGHHNVHRRTDGDHVEVDVRALHAVAACLGADEVALVFAIGIIGAQDHLSLAKILQSLFNGTELEHYYPLMPPTPK